MKLIRCLVIAALFSACSENRADDRTVDPATAPSEAAPAPPQPAVGTTGEAPAAANPQPRATVARDARAAETGPVTTAARADGVNPQAAVLRDFMNRIEEYRALHRDAAKGSAKLKETKDPAEIVKAQEALAARIRALRAGAQPGDIFTAEVRHHVRRLLAPELTGDEGRDARALMKDDAPPPGSIPFTVNAKYPEGQPLPTVAATVLLALPTLPAPLEYRIIGKHLVLLDTDANLIVDYVPNAMK